MGTVFVSCVRAATAAAQPVLSPTARSCSHHQRPSEAQPGDCRLPSNLTCRVQHETPRARIACAAPSVSALAISTPTGRSRSACCARAISGHAAAAPPSSLMNSRRCMNFPKSTATSRRPQVDGHTLPHRRRLGPLRSTASAAVQCPPWFIRAAEARSAKAESGNPVFCAKIWLPAYAGMSGICFRIK
jgi:hypothetical protein